MKIAILFKAIRAARLLSRAYAFVERGDDAKALKAIHDKSFAIVDLLPFTSLSIQHSLIKMFLDYKYSDKMIYQKEIFARIKKSDLNDDEKKLTTRYALIILWISKGKKENSCLKRIIDGISYNRANLPDIYLRRFETDVI